MFNRCYKIGFKYFSIFIFTLVISASLFASNIHNVYADTQVGGPIISDTIWILANSPYVVIANVDVWEGVTLTIEPGVMVKFNKGYSLSVSGQLIVQGTSTQPITFTSNQPTPAPDDWGNIQFTNTAITTTMDAEGNYISGSILKNCVVEYAGNNVDGAIDTHSMLIDHCTVRNNHAYGIYEIGSPALPGRISYNTVYGNSNTNSGGCGIYASYSTVISNTVSSNTAGVGLGAGICASYCTVMDNMVQGNTTWFGGGGIGADNSTVSGNTVSGNTGGLSGGIYASYSTISGNTVNGNTGSGINAGDSTVRDNTVNGNTGSGINADSSTITGNMVSGNTSDYGGGIYARDSIVSGNKVSGNTASNLGGGIYAEFTTVISNTIYANTVSGNGQGSGLYYFASLDGTGTIIGNTIVGNNISTPPAQGAIIGGLALDFGTAQVHYNNLYGNQPYDVVVITSDISGTNNYWGTVDSVDILSQIYDWYDDNSRGKFIYIPYLQEPSLDAPFPPPLGLEANSQNGSVILTWDALPSFQTGWGYKVYYDSDSSLPPYKGTGLNEGNSPIDVGSLTTFTLTGLDPRKNYYFTVTAYDNTGRESWYSNWVWKEGGYKLYLPLLKK